MASTIQKLVERQVIRDIPPFITSNTMYECVVGSFAYGTNDELSDFDVNGFCIPPREVVFPHLAGEIEGFGRHKKRFTGWQLHHVWDQDALGGRGREYDFNIYNIVHFMHLCLENNPNMVTALYVPRECILHSTSIAEMVREKRDLFLHKGSWHRYKGFSYSQRHKMLGKNPEEDSKRQKIREKYGYDVKFAYHMVRTLYEVEMILNEGTIEIRRHQEHLKAIRRGEVTQEAVLKWCDDKESSLELAYESSQLRYGPDQQGIKTLLLNCLEHHYGSLEAAVARPGELDIILDEMSKLTAQYERIKGRR